MAAHSAWFNLENSVNPFQNPQQSSRAIFRNNQNSLTYFGRFPFFRQEQSRNQVNFTSNIEELFPFNESSPQPKTDQTKQNLIENKVEQKLFDEESQESQKQIKSSDKKKGLKNLSNLLIRTLKRENFTSHRQLTQKVQQVLLSDKKLSRHDLVKQSKNIRRRIYDALNVMLSANVLGPDFMLVQNSNSPSFTKKCHLIANQKPKLNDKIDQIKNRIRLKSSFLTNIKRKMLALDWWRNKNLLESHQMIDKKQNDGKLQDTTKFSQDTINCGQNHINFPIVFIQSEQICQFSQSKQSQEELLIMKLKNPHPQIYSQIDFIQKMKEFFQNYPLSGYFKNHIHRQPQLENLSFYRQEVDSSVNILFDNK